MKKLLTFFGAFALAHMVSLTAVAKDEINLQIDNSYIHDVEYTKKVIFLSDLDATSVPDQQHTSREGMIDSRTYKYSGPIEIELANFYDSETGMPCTILTGQGVIKAYTSYQSSVDPDQYIKAHLNIIITGDHATGCRVYQIS